MNKKYAITLIFLGIGILISSLIFSQGYVPQLGFLASLNDMKVVVVEGKYISGGQVPFIGDSGEVLSGTLPGHWEGRVEFPLKFSLLISVFLILFGTAFIFLKKVSDK